MTDADRLLRILARRNIPADLADQARVLIGNVSWSRLFDRAEAHGVVPLAARSLATLGWPEVPSPVRAAFEAAHRINAARNALIARALGRVLDGLGHAGVPVIPLKGVALSESLYGDPSLRVSADLDVLVPRDCVARAWTVLGELGYVMADHGEPVEASELGLLLESNIEVAFASPEVAGCPVELHWDIAWRWPHSAPAIADLWADARPRPFRGAPALVLGPEWELLYLAVHAARHRWESLKWLADIHEVCRRGGLDWERVHAKADRFGLRDVLEISLQASAALFDTPLPASPAARALPDWIELFPATPDPLDLWQGALYPARLFARPSERLAYLARVLLVPTLAERRLIRLPRRLRALYYPLRPLRLGEVGARRGASHRTAVSGSLDIVARSGRSSGVAAAPRPPRRGTDSFEAGERVRSSRLAAALGFLALVFCSVRSAAAFDLGEWIPGLKLTPFFAERMTYETNVFQVPSGSEGDAVFKTIPGFLADYTFGPHSATLGYRAEILNYVTLTSQDTVNHIAVAQLRLDFPRLLVNIRDDFVKTSDPPNTELTGPIESLTNVLAPEAEYRLTTRLSLGANYAWTHVRFPTEEVVAGDLDRDEQLFGGSVFWKIWPKADLRLNYNYGIKNFTIQTDRDVTRNQVLVAVRGDLTAKLSSTFRIGFEKRDPDSSFQPGYLGVIMGGDWTFRPTDRTILTLLTDRSVQESTSGDVPFYVTTSGGVGAQHLFWNKLTASLRATVGQDKYPSKQTVNGQTDWRSDIFFTYGGGLDYEIQPWISVGVEYAHIARRSNFNAFDFQDDKFTAKVTLQF